MIDKFGSAWRPLALAWTLHLLPRVVDTFSFRLTEVFHLLAMLVFSLSLLVNPPHLVVADVVGPGCVQYYLYLLTGKIKLGAWSGACMHLLYSRGAGQPADSTAPRFASSRVLQRENSRDTPRSSWVKLP